MYPFIRLAYQMFLHRKRPSLGMFDTSVSHHICWPWDLDLWNELNNGRTLTIYDLGRIPAAGRFGLLKALAANKWGFTMAGASVRYRRRVKVFDRITMRTRLVSWDDKFMYIEQSMWVREQATSHILYRSAVTSRDGMIPPAQVMGQLGYAASEPPKMPDWMAAWVSADALRPWPPEIGPTN